MKTIIVYLAAFITLGNGIALRAPTVDPTGQVSAKTANWSPKITQPPFPFELFKRDYVTVSQSTIVQLWATDNTCGWGNGNSSNWFTCGTSGTCVFAKGSTDSAAGTTSPGVVSCCYTNTCVGGFKTCIDSYTYYSSTICDNSCASDPTTLKCTATSAPYCNGVTVPGIDARDWYCGRTSTATLQPLLTTYSNMLHPPVFNTKTVTAGITVTVHTTSSTTSSSSSSSSSLGTLSSSSMTISPTPTPEPASSGPPIGAIVGGTLGGVAMLVLLGALLFICYRRRKHNTTSAAAPSTQAAQGAQYPPYTPSMSPAPDYGGWNKAAQSPQSYAAGSYLGSQNEGYHSGDSPNQGYNNMGMPNQGYAVSGSPDHGYQNMGSPASAEGYRGSTYGGVVDAPKPEIHGQGNDMVNSYGYDAEKTTEHNITLAPVHVPTPVHQPTEGLSHIAGPITDVYEAPGHGQVR